MIVLAVLAVTVIILTAQRSLIFNREETWHLLTAALSFGAMVVVVTFSGERVWQRSVLVGFGIWGGTELTQVLYHVLLAAGDLCRLIIQRNTQRRM